MKLTFYIGAAVLLLGGCSSTHIPQPSEANMGSAPLPKLVIEGSDQNNTMDTYCFDQAKSVPVQCPDRSLKQSDLDRFSQSIIPYVEQNVIDRDTYYEVQNNFESRYYLPWTYTTPPQTLEDVSWPFRAFRTGYGNNLRLIPTEWFNEMYLQSNVEEYGSLNQKAISIKATDIRAFPTDKPLFKNPALPGDGYPFDLLQNSTLHFQEPVFISHYSKDRAWSYIFSNNVSGWVKSDTVVPVDENQTQRLMASTKVFLIQDNIPLYSDSNRYVAHSRVGMVLSLDHSDEFNHFVRTITSENTYQILAIPKTISHIGVSRLNKSDLATIGSEMLKNTYGWGGMYQERDCSSMIRDMMTPFGIWLPRNSSSQARRGEVIALNNLSDEEKLTLIKTNGVPFETIIYLKGHVVLYLGTFEGNVLVLHNFWGVRTLDKAGNKGRHIIGKAVISTLELGSELSDFDPSMKLLSRVESMNIFTRSPTSLTRNIKTTLPKKKSL